MEFSELRYYLYKDLLRQVHGFESKSFIKKITVWFYLFFNNPIYRFILLFRISAFFLARKNVIAKVLFHFIEIFRSHYSYKLGIILNPKTKIKGGLYFPHFSSIILTSNAIYGENLTVYQQSTVGMNLHGKKKGSPIIGNNVTICAGAKIIGNIRIGNNVLIGAGAIVVNDVPDDAVVVGNPAKVVSLEGKKHLLI